MGYRHYLGKLSRERYKEMKTKKLGDKELDEIGVYEICDRIYEFGKYWDFAEEMEKRMKPFFNDANTNNHFNSDCCLGIIEEEEVLFIIQSYQNCLDKKSNTIVKSWLFEYAILELVRVYKTIDFEKEQAVIFAW